MKRTILFKSFIIEVLSHIIRYGVLFLLGVALIVGLNFLMAADEPTTANPEADQLEVQIANAKLTLDDMTGYLENSEISKYNPMQIPTYLIYNNVLFTETSDLTRINQSLLVTAQDSVYDMVRDKLGRDLPNQFIDEILSVSYEDKSKVVSIRVFYKDEAKAKEIAHALQQVVNESIHNNSDGTVSIEVLSEVFTSVENAALRDKMTKNRTEVDRLRNQIAANEAKLLDMRQDAQPESSKMKVIKTGLFAIVLSGLLVLGIVAYQVTSNQAKLLVADIRENYQLPVLFGLETKGFIKRFEKNEAQFLTMEQAKNRIHRIAELFPDQSLILVGDQSSEVIDYLTEGSVKLIPSGGFFDDDVSLTNLGQSDLVVLVVEPYKTTHHRFQEQIQLLSQLQKKIVGTIVI